MNLLSKICQRTPRLRGFFGKTFVLNHLSLKGRGFAGIGVGALGRGVALVGQSDDLRLRPGRRQARLVDYGPKNDGERDSHDVRDHLEIHDFAA